MSIIRALKSLLSIVASALGALAIGVATVAAVVFLLPFAVGLWSPYSCITTVHQRIAGLSGFDFEISETSCFYDPVVIVLVSKASERKKTSLFKYDPFYVGPYPVITSIDEHTIQISVSRVSSIVCRRDKWETLTVKYDIGGVTYPDSRAQPDEC